MDIQKQVLFICPFSVEVGKLFPGYPVSIRILNYGIHDMQYYLDDFSWDKIYLKFEFIKPLERIELSTPGLRYQ